MYARSPGRAPRDPPATRAASPRRPGPPDTMGWAPRVRAEGLEGEVEDGRFSSRYRHRRFVPWRVHRRRRMTPVSVNIRAFGAVEVRPMRFRQGTFRIGAVTIWHDGSFVFPENVGAVGTIVTGFSYGGKLEKMVPLVQLIPLVVHNKPGKNPNDHSVSPLKTQIHYASDCTSTLSPRQMGYRVNP